MNINHLCMGCMREKPSLNMRCPYCGYDDTTQNNKKGQLPIWTFMRKSYMVGRCLGDGGFGITYLGFDVNLQKKIAIKEFFPDGFAVRAADGFNVYPSNEQTAYFFEQEKARFVEEARILAQIGEQPGVVKVISFLVENNTAYIIMEFIEGTSLKKYMENKGYRLSVSETLDIMRPIVKALAGIHDQGVVHRDISLDNIMITTSGIVKLIDFGAAHDNSSIGDVRVFKPNYSPIEQRTPDGKIDTYSDIYALCVCMYTAITGKFPRDASQRWAGDVLIKPSQMGIAIDTLVEAALMKGLEFSPQDRIKNATDLYYFLYIYGKGGNASVQGMEQKIKESSTEVIIEKIQTEQVKKDYKKRNMFILYGILILAVVIIGTRVAIREVVKSKTNQASSIATENINIEMYDQVLYEEVTQSDVDQYLKDFYNYFASQHSKFSYTISPDFESFAKECAKRCAELDVNSPTWAQDAMTISKELSVKYNLSSTVRWVINPYLSKNSVESIYADVNRDYSAYTDGELELSDCINFGSYVMYCNKGLYLWVVVFE